MKELQSGIKVDSQQYYQLLEWKDSNRQKFEFFITEYRLKSYSINNMNQENYNALLQFANLD